MRPEDTDRDVMLLEGTVVEAHRGDLYRVECQAGSLRREVLARRSGRLTTARIKMIAGDRVQVEVGAYDMTRGRIVRRLT